MADPKYPDYKGVFRFDDDNILEAEITSSSVDVKLNDKTIGGDLAGLDMIILDPALTVGLATKIKKAWFNHDPGAGASASSPVIVPGASASVFVFNCKLATSNVVRVNSSSADCTVWLKEAPTGTPFSAASGGAYTGWTVNCCFKEPAAPAPDYGLTGATFKYSQTLPDIADIML